MLKNFGRITDIFLETLDYFDLKYKFEHWKKYIDMIAKKLKVKLDNMGK